MITLFHSFSKVPLCCKLEDVNPEWFFSEDPDEMKLAQSICSHCPIKRECLDWANSIEKDQKFIWGIYGGLSSTERKKMFT